MFNKVERTPDNTFPLSDGIMSAVIVYVSVSLSYTPIKSPKVRPSSMSYKLNGSFLSNAATNCHNLISANLATPAGTSLPLLVSHLPLSSSYEYFKTATRRSPILMSPRNVRTIFAGESSARNISSTLLQSMPHKTLIYAFTGLPFESTQICFAPSKV